MRTVLFLCLSVLVPSLVLAQTEMTQAQLNELLKVKVRTVQHIALNPVIVRSVRRQNAQTVSAALIAERDEAWQASSETDEFKRSLQENKAGRLLKTHVSASSSFNEAFLTDNKGANVAAFPATSDYFQGDEEKWSASFNGGDGRVFLGPLERDESTNVYAVQVSAPVLDKGKTIGVLVVGVTLDYLDAKRAD